MNMTIMHEPSIPNNAYITNKDLNSSSSGLSSSGSNTSNESKTNLIINYLPQTMTTEELKNVFQTVGPVDSCKLIKDKTSHQSLCYGFVNYVNLEDADKAIKVLNGLKLENKVIKVSYARPSSESIKGANLYICGIPKHWTLEDMNNYFSSCGKIITSRILINSLNGQSKGVGFIRYDQRHEADLAINKLEGTIPEGAHEPVTVKFANYPTESKNKLLSALPFVSSTGYLGSTKLSTNSSLQSGAALAALRSGTNPQLLSAASSFQPRYSFYGTEFLCNDNLMTTQSLMNQNSLHAMGISQSASNNCIASLTSGSGWCIFVYNLAPETEENVLWQMFGPFGAVQNIKIIRDFQTQKCKGFGFVTMSSYDDAVNAINSLNGITLANRILQVSFKTNLNKN